MVGPFADRSECRRRVDSTELCFVEAELSGGLLTLEDTIRRYTFQPARIMGLADRGLVREGMAADLMVFDLARIGVKDDEVSRDGPGGTPRRVQGAEGVHHVIVNGKPVLDHGRHSGAFPGRVLRAGRR